MKKLTLILFVLVPVLLSAQKKQDQALIDSLVHVLESDIYRDRVDTEKAAILIDLTYNYYDINPDKGIQYGMQGLQISEQLNWKRGLAKLNTYLGANYYVRSDYPKALDYWLKALKINEELGNKKDYAVNLLNVGRIYLDQKDFENALNYFFKALKINEELKDKINIPLNLDQIGSAYLAQNNFNKALEYYNKALEINKLHNNKSGISLNTGNIGSVYLNEGNYPRALEYYFQAYPMDVEQDDTSSMAIELGNIGESYLNIYKDTSGKFNSLPLKIPGKDILDGKDAIIPKDKKAILQKSIDYLNQSIIISKKLQFLNALQYYSKTLSEAQALSGNYKEALETYKQYSTIRDSVFSTENNAKISSLESRRETELKEKQIEVQQLQIIADKNEQRYFIAAICLFSIFSLGLYGRFRIMRRNKRMLEEKNTMIEAEKETADAMRMRAESSEKFKQQFLANMSHEIRTPMNAISGMTDILLDKDPRPDQENYLRVISKSSDILLHIINDILDLSKIEAGKLELESIDFSLADTVQHVRETLSIKAEEKGLLLTTNIDKQIADVLIGDPFRLNQILLNLGGNAIKFTDWGTVEIKVELAKEENDKEFLKFYVTDTGIGIPADKIKTIFESFRQAKSSDARKYGGTGLGLSISKQLVELQGGELTAESVPGSGSTFTFTIAYPKGSDIRLKEHTEGDLHADGSELNGLRILLADDNEYNRFVVTETLRLKADVLIDEALNGKQAIRLMEGCDYDVVLMDVQMPEMNGFEATRYIREKLPPPKNKTPVIALTASLLRADIDMCYRNGMNTYLPKPFKTWQLIKTIAEQAGRIYIHPHEHFHPYEEHVHNREHKHAPEPEKPEEVNDPKNEPNIWTNLDYLKKFCEGDEKRMKKYINVFMVAVPVLNEKLLDAISINDNVEIALQVHGFKPKWMMMGMKQTAELGQRIDGFCKNQDNQDKIRTDVLTLLEQNQAAANELKQFL